MNLPRLPRLPLCVISISLPLTLRAATFNPVADAFVDSAQPGNNFGLAGGLAISASGLPKGEFESFMAFDVPALDPKTIQFVTLQLNATRPSNPIFNGNGTPAGNVNTAGAFTIALLQDSSWIEGKGTPNAPDPDPTHLDFNNAPSYLAAGEDLLGTFAFDGSSNGPATYNLELTPALLANLQSGGPFGLYFFAADSSISYVFNSTNFNIPVSRPVLTINSTPEPETAGLALSGAGVVLLSMRPRRAFGQTCPRRSDDVAKSV